MVIKELYMKNFGKLKEQHFFLRDGLQVISGENESGKTTLHAFIRAMLFGLERGRGRAAAKDDYTRYEPWEMPGHYAGVMRFSCGGRNFRLERSFDRYTKSASLVCEDDGEELSVEHGDLDMLLGGLTPGVFDGTVSVGQLQAEPGQELYEVLENHAVNYFETGSGEIDLAGALRLLKENRKETQKSLREEDAAREAERDKLMAEIRYLEREMAALQKEYESKKGESCKQAEERTERTSVRRPKELREEMPEAPDTEGTAGTNSILLTGIAGLLIGAAGILWSFLAGGGDQNLGALPVRVIAGIIALTGAGFLAAGIVRRLRRFRQSRQPGKSGQSGQFRQSGQRAESGQPGQRGEEMSPELEENLRRNWELERIHAEYKEKEIRRENLQEQWAECGLSDTQKKLRRSAQALEMAEKALQEAARETGAASARAMKERASRILGAVTENAYSRLETDGGRQITVWDGSRRIPAERLSRGTIEQIYFAIRMAAAETLLTEPVPVIFDDAFVFYDDKRLESALKWLSRQEKQVIILTCQKREEEIVKRLRG